MTYKYLFFVKLFSLALIFILSGCSLVEPNLTDEEVLVEVDKVVQSIQAKPEWLSFDEPFSVGIVPSFQKEIEYLDEGCKNKPNGCFKSCQNGDGNACYSLALLIQRRKDIELREPDALFLRSCKLGIISGCTNYTAGKLNLAPEDLEINKTAKQIFEKTCEKNDAWGCQMNGMLAFKLAENKQDIEKSLQILSKVCSVTVSEDEACIAAKRLIEHIAKEQNNIKK